MKKGKHITTDPSMPNEIRQGGRNDFTTGLLVICILTDSLRRNQVGKVSDWIIDFDYTSLVCEIG